jgi:hypothetical protein
MFLTHRSAFIHDVSYPLPASKTPLFSSRMGCASGGHHRVGQTGWRARADLAFYDSCLFS